HCAKAFLLQRPTCLGRRCSARGRRSGRLARRLLRRRNRGESGSMLAIAPETLRRRLRSKRLHGVVRWRGGQLSMWALWEGECGLGLPGTRSRRCPHAFGLQQEALQLHLDEIATKITPGAPWQFLTPVEWYLPQ